ncbi:hypothetical protein ACSX1C_00780 [Pseudomonas sp. MBLB4123]|uniref:hypothetical protein n=1 Tax=Pseudomonas sp. MBLB4123 TaxID=3451557 RepID=UPI003F7512F2
MNNTSKLTLALVTALLIGCSGVPYAPKGTTMYAGGYTDKKIAENTFLVTFEGNGYNTTPQVVGFVKKRAEEICSPLKADVEIREYLAEVTNHAALNGQLYTTNHKFPSAEGTVTCTSRT